MAFAGRNRDRTMYNDRFDAMSEGELVAEALSIFSFDRYEEFRAWYQSMPDVEFVRSWVRANSAHTE